MAQCEVTIRKWGNSFGFTIPKEIVESEKLKENETITIILTKKLPKVSDSFGLLKGKLKIDSQKMKDDIRKEEMLAERRNGR